MSGRRPPRLSGAPLFVQVLGVLVLGLLGAQIVNALILTALPPPRPTLHRLADVAEALRSEAPPPGTPRLIVRVLADAPAERSDRRRGGRRFIEAAQTMLADELAVSDDRVRVVLRDRDAPLDVFLFRTRVLVLRGDGGRGRGGPPPVAGPDFPGGFPVDRRLDQGELVVFEPFVAAYRRDDGSWVTAEARAAFPAPWQRRIMIWLLGALVLLTPLAWWLARRLTSPIAAFAEAADRLGRDPAAPALSLDGSAEVVKAAGAFNRMQDRLRRYVEDRTAMIGAVAHDLRTPLMRMRFLLEGDPAKNRPRIEREIAEMDVMLGAVLAFVRDASTRGERVRLDLRALLEAQVEDLAETGAAVDFVDGEGEPAPVLGDPLALRRMFDNILGNALKFAGSAEARLWVEGGQAVVEVADRGPGLPEDELERAFDPFHRSEASRNEDTGGIGLGLAVVRSAARGHGGEATLSNRPEGGLICRVVLPLDGGP